MRAQNCPNCGFMMPIIVKHESDLAALGFQESEAMPPEPPLLFSERKKLDDLFEEWRTGFHADLDGPLKIDRCAMNAILSAARHI